jgi:hypothetical protein
MKRPLSFPREKEKRVSLSFSRFAVYVRAQSLTREPFFLSIRAHFDQNCCARFLKSFRARAVVGGLYGHVVRPVQNDRAVFRRARREIPGRGVRESRRGRVGRRRRGVRNQRDAYVSTVL